MLTSILRLDRLTRRHAGKMNIWLAGLHAVVGIVAAVLGYEIIAVVSLVGFTYEMNRMEIAKLREELHRKRMWHEGEL